MKILKLAAIMIAISAVLHLIAPLMSSFSAEGLDLLPFALVYAVLAWLVWKNKRWATWVAFLVTLFFGIFGLAGFLSPDTIPGWVSLGIWVTDWIAAICLFLVLWGDHRSSPTNTHNA